MEQDLLFVLETAARRPTASKDAILNELRRLTARRLWSDMAMRERAYAFGLVGLPLPAQLEWDDLSLEHELAISHEILRWARRPPPTNATLAAHIHQAEPGPIPSPVGC